MKLIETYNSLNHPIDMPGGRIVPSGSRVRVDPDDPMIVGYLGDGALIEVEPKDSTDDEPAPEVPVAVAPSEDADEAPVEDEGVTPEPDAEPEPAPTKPTRSKRGGSNGNADGVAASTTTTED